VPTNDPPEEEHIQGKKLGSAGRLHANCMHCQHSQALDLVDLRERLGPDHSVLHDDLAPKLKCSKCGGKKVGPIISPPTGSSGWVNPYIKSKGQ
jgi:hypothetical protein